MSNIKQIKKCQTEIFLKKEQAKYLKDQENRGIFAVELKKNENIPYYIYCFRSNLFSCVMWRKYIQAD